MKRFKDPIYGYIKIPKNLAVQIIDTPEFQRLRYIKQTSYSPVYAAALHNRFVHSLGVYFLGQKAYDAIRISSSDVLEKAGILPKTKQIFELACLLHDIGHSPFSHSGEVFYIDEKKSIYDALKDAVNDADFTVDMDFYHKNGQIAAPHEIMSVIVALTRFKEHFDTSDERSFFARCITGYTYRSLDSDMKYSVYNAFISLLNSTIIDVDKLDYLIRDSFVMGYNSISIDYNRLLESLVLIEVTSSEHITTQLAYKKSALSVIENAIYAHDAERKWIQNHPVILYEVFLIRHIITKVATDYKKRTSANLFSIDSVCPSDKTKSNEYYTQAIEKLDAVIKAVESKDSKCDDIIQQLNNVREHIEHLSLPINISLLCDDDIIYLAKQSSERFCEELFNRNIRRHPIWKSESEYRVWVDGFVGDEAYPKLQFEISVLTKFLKEESATHCIDDKTIEHCESCLTDIEKMELTPQDKQNMKERYTLLLKWLRAFKKICEEQELSEFSFVIVPANKFKSGFKKSALGEVPIYFPESRKTYPLKKLIDLFSVKENERSDFFYVYYTKTDKEKINAYQVGREIAKIVLE